MLNELIYYAENMRDEAAEQGEDIATIRYWVGYIDGLKTVEWMLKGGEGE